MKRIITLAFAFSGLLASVLQAQTLTMDQTIRLAQDSTIEAHVSTDALMKARWEYEQFLAQRRPQVSFALSPGYQKISFEPATYFYKLRNYNMFNAFAELRMEQKALGIGGEFYASTGALWTRYFSQDDPSRLFSTVPVGVGYSNDLISYNPYKWEKELNELKLSASEKEYRHSLGTIALETVKLYVKCYVAMAEYDIWVSNSKVAGELLDIGKEKYNIASISKNELSALELQSLNAENSLFNAKAQMEDARSRLLSYLNMDDSGQELNLVAPDVPAYKSISLEEAVALAKANNPEYIRNYEQVVSARQQADRAKAQGRLLRMGVDLNLGLQSTSDALGGIYAGQQPYMIGSLTLRIPIFDGGLARSRNKVAQYGLDHAEDVRREAARKIELDVKVALREFNIQQDLLLRTARALALADESFELAQDLYMNGETDINTFILAQSRKDDAHSNYLNSLTGFWVSYYTLCMLCDKEF
ncbi:MAG: TolC family protein [Bacteroidales bacterium]|nr:TolC family protein [Candidatus Cacconaster merdequi]